MCVPPLSLPFCHNGSPLRDVSVSLLVVHRWARLFPKKRIYGRDWAFKIYYLGDMRKNQSVKYRILKEKRLYFGV
jgi:hypothetical protein